MINMIPEIGHILLIMSTVFALLSATSHLIGSYQHNFYLIAFGNRLFYALFFTLLTALCCLVFNFIADDFSVAYVANHSNSQLALGYKVAAVWGSHEGSMLFWVFAIALWGAVINWRQATQSAKLELENLHADKAYFGRVLAILALVILGFNLFYSLLPIPLPACYRTFQSKGATLTPYCRTLA